MCLKRSSPKIMYIIILCSCTLQWEINEHVHVHVHIFFFNEQGHLAFLKQNERIDCSSLQLIICIIHTFVTRYKELYHHYYLYINVWMFD